MPRMQKACHASNQIHASTLSQNQAATQLGPLKADLGTRERTALHEYFVTEHSITNEMTKKTNIAKIISHVNRITSCLTFATLTLQQDLGSTIYSVNLFRCH